MAIKPQYEYILPRAMGYFRKNPSQTGDRDGGHEFPGGIEEGEISRGQLY